MRRAEEITPAVFRAKDSRKAVCPKHGPYMDFLLLPHKGLWSGCPMCKQEHDHAAAAQDEARAKAEIAAWNIERLIGQTCIPPRFANRSFANFRTDEPDQKMALGICVRYSETDWESTIRNGRNLCILGRPGTGKTHLAAAMVRSVVSRGYPAVYVKEPDIFRRVKESYMSRTLSERQAMADFVKPALLVVDEVGRQYGTQAERSMFFDVIDQRYENMKPTVLVSNLDQAHFCELMGPAICSRLSEGGGKFLVLAGKDMRREVARHGLA
nr:MAG TPA: Replicative helicase [Caudoviricetes sp.]